MLKFFKKGNLILQNLEYAVVSMSVILLAIMLCGNIISRLVQKSWNFSEEIGLLFIIVITYIGSIYAVRYGRHIRVTFLTDMLPDRFHKGLYVMVCILSAAAFFFFTYWAVLYLLQAKELGRVTAALAIPKWTFQIPIVIGLLFTGVQYLITAIMNIVSKDKVYVGSSREMGEEIDIQ